MKKLLCLFFSLVLLFPLSVFAATDENESVTVNKGETFTIKLSQVSSGGYTWSYNIEPVNGLTLISDTSTQDSNLVGAPTTRTFVFRADVTGKFKIDFVQARPWDKSDITSKKTYEVTVNEEKQENNTSEQKTIYTFTVCLIENEATGYNWKYDSLPKGVSYISDCLSVDACGNKLRIFTFNADNAGPYTINFTGQKITGK